VVNFQMQTGGIVGYSDDLLPIDIWAKVRAAEDGRLEITEVYIRSRGEGVVQTGQLRKIPLGRIESLANRPDRRQILLDLLEGPARSLEEAAKGQIAKEPPVEESEERSRARKRRRAAKLPTPVSRKYPDSFYTKVAVAYLDLVAEGVSPATEIAAVNGVPVTQVHRWIKEARRRGLLGPGRAGKAG
jgi:hypothetical protein